MAKVETDVYTFKDDVGKNLYRKTTYYTLKVEQDVLAKDKDEADQKFLDHGGINHSKIGKDITDANEGVETYMVDANYQDSDTTEYLGKVCYEDDEYAKEDGFVEIDTYANEDDIINEKGDCVAKEKEMDPMGDLEKVVYGTKEESDVDVSLNLEAESKLGK